MQIPIFQVDAFASEVFSGNPAAVCPLESWLPDHHLQAIAAENNLSETAFFVRNGEEYDLRWFTPAAEVDLCGHATLAAAFVICTELDQAAERIGFRCASGPLAVTRDNGLYALDFPSRPPAACVPPQALADALGHPPVQILAARDYVALYETEREVRALAPDFGRLAAEVDLMVMASAPGDDPDVDFVSRFFAPGLGIPEDPVTGSAHCTLIPYWSRRLNKAELRARQVSVRGGELLCEHRGERVRIAGRAVLYLRGIIYP